MTISEGLLALEGGNVHVGQDGPRDAPVLVLIHGLGGSGRWWDPLVPALARSHHVIRLDLLGHGRSAKPAGLGYEIADHGARIGVVLNRLGVRHAVVAGHSTGGLIATALAGQRPDLVTALALVNTGLRVTARIAEEVGFDERAEDVREMSLHAFAASMQSARDYVRRQALPDRLRALGIPLLAVLGTDDHRSAAATAYRAVPGARVEALPGRSPVRGSPGRTAGLLAAFTARHSVHAIGSRRPSTATGR